MTALAAMQPPPDTHATEAPTTAIRVSGLVKRFGDVEAVRGIDIAVPPGAFLTLVGPSGCGKSTTLRMLAGLEAPSEGEIAFNDQVVSDGSRGVIAAASRRDCGLVFQSYALWPHMTVAGNVDWPLKVANWRGVDRRRRIAEVLDLLAITDLAERYPGEISGGQQQRVAIARMIAPGPSILLFDEPLSNLDAKLRLEMRSELMRVHRASGATSVYVTHDQVEAMTMASHVAVMRDGLVEQFGPPCALLEDPLTAFVATFVGTPPGNLIPADSDGRLLRHGDVPLVEAAGSPAGRMQLLYRPEALEIADGGGQRRLECRLAEVTPIAGRTMVTGLREDGLRLTIVTDRLVDGAPGAPLWVQLPDTPAAIFDDKGDRIG